LGSLELFKKAYTPSWGGIILNSLMRGGGSVNFPKRRILGVRDLEVRSIQGDISLPRGERLIREKKGGQLHKGSTKDYQKRKRELYASPKSSA